jgi:SAM-dependent methyltransferase
VWRRAMFRFRSSDGYWKGLNQLFRLTVSPTESDRETVQLPVYLSSLYTIVRPFRLLGKYGWGRRSKTDLARYQPMPQETVNQMLRFAEISPRDVLYDLGCGDGRIAVTAAEKYGIRAVGVDIDPARIAQARANARRHGVEKRVQFVLGDARTVDLSAATVVTMYLSAEGNLRLVDRLREHLRPGTRIVSLDFQIHGWAPNRVENRILENGLSSSFFLWTIKNRERESEETACAPPGAAAAG